MSGSGDQARKPGRKRRTAPAAAVVRRFEAASAETHGQWARRLRNELGDGVVADGGSFWRFQPDTLLWKEWRMEEAIARVSHWDGPKCKTLADYRAIVQLTYDMLTQEHPHPFESAPVGVAAADAFFRVVDGDVIEESLTREHMARFKLAVRPDGKQPAPLLDDFLESAFPEKDDDHAEQRRVFWQHFAAGLFGIGWKAQKVLLWYGAESSGKSTGQLLLSSMVPDSMVTGVMPHNWDREYNLADLAGKVLNLVGEIDDKHALGAIFKTVTGGDLLQGRYPTHRVFSFRCHATHIINCNGLPPLADRTEAMWRRWSIIHFRHRVPDEKLHSGLAARIIDEELGAVLHRAIEAAKSLMVGNRIAFIETKAHRDAMARWRRQTNSVEEFLHDEEDEWLLKINATPEQQEKLIWEVGRQQLFDAYRGWCKDNGRHGFGRNHFREQMLLCGPRAGVEEGRDEKGTRIWTGITMKF